MSIRAGLRSDEDRSARLQDLGVKPLLPLWCAVGLFMWKGISVFASEGKVGIDAHAYWLTGHHAHLYGLAPTDLDAYLYSPAFAQAIRPLTWLPWTAFYVVWMVAESAAFAWLLRPLGWAWGVPAFMLCGFEIMQGNITGLLAVALVLGLTRLPEAWALPLLTKVLLGLGVFWYLARREWRQLGRIAIASGLIAGVSAVFWPSAWIAWFHLLLDHRGQDTTLPYRFAAAVLLTVFAARRGKAWMLAPLMVLASPVTLGIGEYLTMLAAAPRLIRVPGHASRAIQRTRSEPARVIPG